MPNLLMHQADAYVPRSKVENTPTPSSTRSWRPIPHTRLLETVEANLKDKGFFITSQSHGLSHNHNRYFGLLEIRSSDEAEDYRSIIGVRNSHDKTFPAGVVLGSCVIVCSNLSFSGEISLSRKHTRFIVRDLPELVHQAVDKLLSLRIAERNRITRYSPPRDSPAATTTCKDSPRGWPAEVVRAEPHTERPTTSDTRSSRIP